MAKVLDAGIKSYNAVLSLMAWVAPKTFKLILKSMKQSVNSLAVGFVNFLTRLVRNKYLITEMAKRDLARSYVGSVLGFFWTILNPLVMIFVLWGVFSVGLRITPKNDVPFVIWLTAGLAIWNAFV
ncbi:MAG: hypothetical protein ACE5FU_13305 [Nitrospinota bacterium]